MSKKNRVATNPAVDPTLPDVSIEIAGVQYHLVFTYGALAMAERKLSDAALRTAAAKAEADPDGPRDLVQRINLLEALDLRSIGAERLPLVFYASLITGHPGISPAEAAGLITMRNYADVFAKVVEAFVASMAEPGDKTSQDPILEPAA
jgi:hypothetical protein